MLITLRRVSVSYFEDYGLRGFIETEGAEKRRIYSFRLPTLEEPDPPGWAEVVRLSTTVTTQEVVAAWDEHRTENPAAAALALEISTRYSGEPFLAEETKLADGSAVLRLGPVLNTAIAAPQRRVVETIEAPSTPPSRYASVYNIRAEIQSGEPTYLILSITDVEETKWPRFKVPDANDQTPDGWWFVECFTGISHERVAKKWTTDGNEVLDDVVRILAEVIEQFNHVPLSSDGSVDLVRWRRELLRFRLAQGTKPFIFLGRPDHNIEHTKAVLYDAAGSYLFRAGVEPGESQGCPAIVRDSDGKATLCHLDDLDLMRGILVRFIRFARSGRPPKPANPPKELLADLIRFPDRSWPVINGVVRIPTVRRDGSVITAEGYDRASQLWYAPEFELEPIPDHPSVEDLEHARALLLTPIFDFPFVDEGARTAALCSLFEQIIRPMIRGPRPLYVFDAPEQGQGTGKTLLAKLFQAIITGKDPGTTPIGKREEELQKQITTLLKQQQPFVIFDNLPHEITSESLAQLATTESWQARLLNTNTAPIYPQNTTWVLNMNGVRTDRDMARRVILVSLDAKMPNPYERTHFRIPEAELVDWVLDRRASLIRACLVLVRAWVNDGMPEDKKVVRGSFGGWCRVMGGLMKHAGFGGLADAVRVRHERDVNAEDHRFLIRFWRDEYPVGHPLPAITIGELAKKHGLYDGRLPNKGSSFSIGRVMANILQRSLLGNPIDGYVVKKSPTVQNGYHTYSLDLIRESTH